MCMFGAGDFVISTGTSLLVSLLYGTHVCKFCGYMAYSVLFFVMSYGAALFFTMFETGIIGIDYFECPCVCFQVGLYSLQIVILYTSSSYSEPTG